MLDYIFGFFNYSTLYAIAAGSVTFAAIEWDAFAKTGMPTWKSFVKSAIIGIFWPIFVGIVIGVWVVVTFFKFVYEPMLTSMAMVFITINRVIVGKKTVGKARKK